jgi:hypothetical protein
MVPDEPSHPATKGMLFNVIVTLIEIGGGITLFHVAQRMGASDVVSYLAGSIGPMIGACVIWARARKLSGASISIFAFTIVSAAIAFIGRTTPKALLYKDCAGTAVVGLIFLGSCFVVGKPLVFYMAQRYGTDGTHDGMAVFEKMWGNYPDFRRGMYVTTYLWAALFLVQAVGTALIIHASTYSIGYDYDQILPLAAVALGIVGSIAIGRHFATKGRARGAAAETARAESA